MRKWVGASALVSTIVLVGTAGCSPGGQTGDVTFVWSNSGEAETLDPAYAVAGVSWTPARQIFENLVQSNSDGSAIEPELAQSWDVDESGRTYTFKLQTGVKFSDGTPFNGEAVCANFDRWYNFKGLQQSPGVSNWYQSVFGGFAENEDGSDTKSLYRSCKAADESTAIVTLTRPSASFIPAMTMVPFAMVSPTAAEKYDAADISGDSASPNLDTPFGTQHPIGTGPYVLDSWERGQQINLKANPDYWGDPPDIDRVVIQSLSDATAKFQAVESGNLNGYENVAASDAAQFAQNENVKTYVDPPNTVGYVGFNQTLKPFDNPQLREAITHALDRRTVVESMFDKGSQESTQLTPSNQKGYTDDLIDQQYDPKLAKKIIADAGLDGTAIEFAYPSGVSRPYMPNPSNIFQAFQENLEDIGLKVKPVEIPWSQYTTKLLGGDLGMYLWGSIGSYPSASYFLDLYMSQTKLPDDLRGNVEGLLDEADSATSEGARTAKFEQVNSMLMKHYVAVPYVEPSATTVISAQFGGYESNSYSNIRFADLTVGG